MNQETKVAFDGGAVRSGRLPPFEDIPYEALEEIANRFAIGEEKYNRFNWKGGGPEFFRQAISHALRHLILYGNGNEKDETAVSNLAAAAWGCIILLWWEKTGRKEWEKTHTTASLNEEVARTLYCSVCYGPCKNDHLN